MDVILFSAINLSKQGTTETIRDQPLPKFSQNQLGYNIVYRHQHEFASNAMAFERKTNITGIN